ncbi:Oidioi.mRNA.OKI2018_I69.XSR.g15982.t1.cds [Oikopleura dioica]|uniref:Oidioi.mRNA.OKI2018_I69.XSR.g15982.t1.cds n=1 Tax=Oikopleura dioica TaxID=34765 RepID=A0ABN7SJP4_OIKDI|nr:Oidioi.mRNA.OKI2018_I69.XSR.g15982.t1.cds [Oikopleura dioica]
MRSSESCISEMKRNFNNSIRKLDSTAPIEESFDFQDIPECTERSCSPDFGNSRFWDFYYYTVRMGVSFLIPLVIMIFCNVGMIRALMIVVRTQICWAPVNISNIISDLGRSQPGSFSAPLTESMSGIENGGQGGVGLWHLATRVGTDSDLVRTRSGSLSPDIKS